MPDSILHLAVLIDADNAVPATIGHILSEVATLGTASVKRVYGDFTNPNLHSWRDTLAEHAIQPIQQFRNTVGKNASDSALIIDAMDLLHTRRLGGFCLVSSDSDFTRLATRIREDNLPVFGFGRQTTPKAFIQACNRFIYTEKFQNLQTATKKSVNAVTPAPLIKAETDLQLQSSLEQAVESAMTDTGKVPLATVGNYLSKLSPGFDPRNYGFQKLSDLVETIPSFTLTRDGTNNVIYVERSGTPVVPTGVPQTHGFD